MAAIGLSIGLVLALLLTRALSSALFGVMQIDTLTIALLTLALSFLALLAAYLEARHGQPLASESVRPLLDVEVAPETETTDGGRLHSRPDSTDESSEQIVGSTSHPWRASQVGNRSGAIDGR